MLTKSMMRTRFYGSVVGILILSGCAFRSPVIKAPANGLFGTSEAPFLQHQRVEVPAESKALSHFMKGNLLLGEGRFDEALAEFESAADVNPEDAFLRFRLATLYVRKGDLKRGLVEAEAARRMDPNSLENRLLLAGLYSSLGENQKGIAEYHEVLKLDPKNQEYLLYLGAIYLKNDDTARATEMLDNLLKLDSDSVLGHYYLGRVRAKSKLYLAAEQSYRRALELNPKSEAVLMDLALVYELQGKTEEAIQTYQ